MSSHNCIDYKENQILSYSDHVIENRTIRIQPIPYVPHISVSHKNSTNDEKLFEICGPLLMMIIELARLSHSGVKFYTKWEDTDGFMEGMMSGFEIVLGPATASQYFFYGQFPGPKFWYSDCVGFLEMGTFAAKVTIGQVQLFKYLDCFSLDVWALIVCLLLLVSFISSMKKLSIKQFTKFILYYSMTMLMNSTQKFLMNNCIKRVLGIWFAAVFIVNITFSAFLMEYIVRGQPLVILNNLDQLAQTNLNLSLREDSSLNYIIDKENKVDLDISRAFQSRVEIFGVFDEIKYNLTERLSDGTTAYVNTRLALIYDLIELRKIAKSDETLKGLQSLHISEDSGGLEPYFLFINEESKEWLLFYVNIAISRLTESGIYQKWLESTDEFVSDEQDHKFDWTPLGLANVFDVFYLLLIGVGLSLVVIVFEYIIKIIWYK